MRLRVRQHFGYAASVLMGACYFAACTSAQVEAHSCPSIQGSGDWALSMMAEEADYRVNGTVHFGKDNEVVELLAVTSEGTGELIESQIQEVRIIRDSISFTFAPIGFVLKGRCLSPDHLEGAFSVPQPPFSDIRGRWSLLKIH